MALTSTFIKKFRNKLYLDSLKNKEEFLVGKKLQALWIRVRKNILKLLSSTETGMSITYDLMTNFLKSQTGVKNKKSFSWRNILNMELNGFKLANRWKEDLRTIWRTNFMGLWGRLHGEFKNLRKIWNLNLKNLSIKNTSHGLLTSVEK